MIKRSDRASDNIFSFQNIYVALMRAAERLLGLVHAIRGGAAFAGQASHPILHPYALSLSGIASKTPQLHSLASFSSVCQPREPQVGNAGSAPPTCMHQRHARFMQQHNVMHCYATAAQGGFVPSLKQRLRELMLLVHPDRWTAHPAAQLENERSFKLLNEYLEAAKSVSSA